MLLLAVVSLEIPLGLSLRDRVDSEVRSQARAEADVVAATAADLMTPGAVPSFDGLTATAARSTRGRVVIVDRRGRLVADSGSPQPWAPLTGRPEVAAALRGRIPAAAAQPDTRHGSPCDRRPGGAGGSPAGAVRVTQRVDAVNAL